MIIYFSGTGNSKYVADMLGKSLDDQVVDATKMIKNKIKVNLNQNVLLYLCHQIMQGKCLVFLKSLLKNLFLKVTNQLILL